MNFLLSFKVHYLHNLTKDMVDVILEIQEIQKKLINQDTMLKGGFLFLVKTAHMRFLLMEVYTLDNLS